MHPQHPGADARVGEHARRRAVAGLAQARVDLPARQLLDVHQAVPLVQRRRAAVLVRRAAVGRAHLPAACEVLRYGWELRRAEAHSRGGNDRGQRHEDSHLQQQRRHAVLVLQTARAAMVRSPLHVHVQDDTRIIDFAF